jgi:hypothetical protein
MIPAAGNERIDFEAVRFTKEAMLSRSIKSNRPTARGALVEVLVVLAIGTAAFGVYRGWFTYADGNPREGNEKRRGLQERMRDSEHFARSSPDLR